MRFDNESVLMLWKSVMDVSETHFFKSYSESNVDVVQYRNKEMDMRERALAATQLFCVSALQHIPHESEP